MSATTEKSDRSAPNSQPARAEPASSPTPADQQTEKTNDHPHENANTSSAPEKAQPSTSPGKKSPAGGYDSTLPPRAPPGYTLRFTFHRAVNLPFADINTLSSDPYLLVQLNTSLPLRHKQDPRLRVRTPTIQRSVHPEWNYDWTVANVPADGFKLKARIYDEDPGDQDDRLGNVHVDVSNVSETWEGIREQGFSIKKRMGSKRAYLFRGCAAMFNRNIRMSGELVISVRVLGRTEGVPGGRLFTVGPCAWSKHYSPLFGRITGTKDPGTEVNGKKVQRYNFQANQMQLRGPVPEELYHRYVEFKPFIAGMFTSGSVQGWLLNRALHIQHSKIYHYDPNTEYGSFPDPCSEMTRKFLELAHYDRGGRIFTYIITLDGLWRFTETGKEFGIDMLSKHTMHSDVSIYIAFSGEFFIRRLKSPRKGLNEQETHPPAEISGGPPHDDPPKDPSHYHLIIDNDSGTYRPNKALLPQLKRFLEHNLVGLRVTTLDCQGDAERMNKMKGEQRERHKAEGDTRLYVQGDDSSSISSSDVDDLDARAGGQQQGRLKKMVGRVREPGERFSDVVHGRANVGQDMPPATSSTGPAASGEGQTGRSSRGEAAPSAGGEPGQALVGEGVIVQGPSQPGAEGIKERTEMP